MFFNNRIMKQIIQNLKSGETILEDIPAPKAGKGQVLIQTTRTLVSLGTERMLVEFGKASLISKARQQPDKVKQVLDKVKSDGLLPTMEAVFKRLDQPLTLGYCNVGKVIDVGEGVSGFKIGDRVASNGHHAEFVTVPQNLVAAIPDNVSDEEATFTVIGSIGLQGIRLLDPTMGETVVVVGLGLIGLITAELLMANGCNVIGIDLDDTKLAVAKEKGIQVANPKTGIDPVKFVESATNGVGADGVIITASAKTDELISQAARMCRKRGKVVLVGVIGLNLRRSDFYDKEISFQVSCSYGPGRYDDDYEQKGIDYPIGYVRWTEKRNFETVLNSISKGRLKLKPLITEVIQLADYNQIYGEIGSKNSIASIIAYPENSSPATSVKVNTKDFSASKGNIGIIGTGNFTKMVILPAMGKIGTNIKSIASARGVSSTIMAKKYGIGDSTTDYQQILNDPEVDTVMITTRHNMHANMVIEAMNAGKNVFVEKPLALNSEELNEVIAAYENNNATLTVGFNRRFSPHIQKVKEVINEAAPKNMIANMNAGTIPSDVWVHDMLVGGGRIIGEACHLIDLLAYISGSKVKSVCMNAMGNNPEENTDNATILLKFENGDNGVVNYFANGDKSYSKERVEVYSEGKVMIVDNFRLTNGYGTKGFSKLKTKLDKGHAAQFKLLTERAKDGGEALIPFDELVNASKASIAAVESLKSNAWINI